ncbi:MAG: ABC transporter substrate-binding protein [Magnetovibrio sp.]|nr:ABC transporter substrate-binding protein [Magnetovibrio sp.]
MFDHIRRCFFAFALFFAVGLFSSHASHAGEKIVLQLRWDHQFQFAGFYAAKWQGYYEAAGLDVEIRSAFDTGKRVHALDEVAQGQAQFGIGGADLFLARERGENLAVVASYFQHSPVEILVHEGSGIRGPADLIDRRMAFGSDPLIDAEVDTMFRLEGVLSNAVKKVSLSDKKPAHAYLNDLDVGSIDALPVYALSSLWAAQKSGMQFTRLRPASYGVDFYGDSLIVNRAWAEDNLETLNAFVEASNKGWVYALQNSESMVEDISTNLPRHVPLDDVYAYNRFLAKEISSIMLFPTIEPGSLNPRRWEHIGHALWQNGLIKFPPAREDFVLLPGQELDIQQQTLIRNVIIVGFMVLGAMITYALWQRSLHRKDVCFRELFENMHNGVAVCRAVDRGKDFVLTDFNKGGELIEKVRREQVIGKRVTEVFPGIEEYGLLEVFKRVLRSGKAEYFPLKYYEDNQVQGWRNNYIYRLPNKEVVAVYEDDTARKKAEQELEIANRELENRIEARTSDLKEEAKRHKETTKQLNLFLQAVEQSQNMIFITNIDGDIEYTNPKFTELTGYSQAEAIGQKPSILKSGETPDDVYKDLWTSILAGKDWQGEIKDCRKNGDQFWAAVSITPVRDRDNQITHFVAMHEDITHRRLADEKIRSAMERAKVASLAKSELMANMSHELRTPLNAIIGFSNTICDELLGPIDNEKYKEYAGDIYRSGEHLLELINDILDVSAIEKGKLELQEEYLDLDEIVDATICLIRPQAEKEKIQLRWKLDEHLPAVCADRRRTKQILINMLSNAVKFTPESGSVDLIVQATPSQQIQFVIRDTGVGMTPEELSKAKTQFCQVDTGLDRKYEGAGLGLSLTMSLVELHGGEFDITSSKGEGTQVTITYPPERSVMH